MLIGNKNNFKEPKIFRVRIKSVDVESYLILLFTFTIIEIQTLYRQKAIRIYIFVILSLIRRISFIG